MTQDLATATFFPTVKRDGIALVDWWAAWCGACRAFAPIYAQVAAKFSRLTAESTSARKGGRRQSGRAARDS
jgi:thiol-disulfide isomerase/thioredoxin